MICFLNIFSNFLIIRFVIIASFDINATLIVLPTVLAVQYPFINVGSLVT